MKPNKNSYYFRHDDETCYKLPAHLKYMEENEIDAMYIYPAKRETNTSYFYCKEFGEIGEKGNACKYCDKYKPRNGKSGVCQHWGYTYEQTKERIKIERK